MSEKPPISDEPLPDADLVPAADVPAVAAQAENPSHATEQSVGSAGHVDLHEQLPSPHLDQAASGYGHTDPASLAAGISLDLHDPELKPADQDPLNQPIWGQSGPAADEAAAADGNASAGSSAWSQMPPVLAHLAQVGLTSSDQWEEQIQPRMQQLHEDIAQVHAQLDVLERQKPKK